MQRNKVSRRMQPLKRDQVSPRRPRSPNGVRRNTTTHQMRNNLVVDLGEDVHGIREALRTKALNDCRSISSIVREILKKTLIDFQVK
jgi:hypothetical protein